MTAPAYVQRLGDDALIAAQRMTEWCTRAPQLEEDVALANIALDLLGQARALLSHAGALEGLGRDEDDLAYLRDEQQFHNVQLVELANGDFAVTIARLLFLATYQHLLYQQLSRSVDPQLSAIAVKAAKESAYHAQHAQLWTLRLGDGTAHSHQRMQQAVEDIWPYTHDLFTADDLTAAAHADGTGADPATLRAPWLERVTAVLRTATLTVPDQDWAPSGGRQGIHTEALGPLLAEMQVLHRAHPGARW